MRKKYNFYRNSSIFIVIIFLAASFPACFSGDDKPLNSPDSNNSDTETEDTENSHSDVINDNNSTGFTDTGTGNTETGSTGTGSNNTGSDIPVVIDDPVIPGNNTEIPGNTVDAVSSATPGIPSALLTSIHTGWAKPNCIDCHTVNHNASYREPNCTACHGLNGTKNIPSYHNLSHDAANSYAECSNCHSGAHNGRGYESPTDCKACHRLKNTATPSFTEEYDVVVIGAGGGGLASAGILARAGMKVLLIEKHYKVGGCFGNFKRGDYTFEIGLHGEPLSMMSLLIGMLGKPGEIQEEMCSPIFMRSLYPDFTIDIPASPWKFETLLKEMYPDDASDITRLFDQLMFFAGAPYYAFHSSQKFFDIYTDNEQLVHIITQMALYMNEPLNELAVPLMMFMFNGYNLGGFWYPIGTTQKVADAFADMVVEEGGRVELNTLATKIVVEDNTATEVWTNHGGRYKARHIVSGANAIDTFYKLVGRQYLPEKLTKALDTLEPAQSSVNVYLGVDKDFTGMFPVGSHEISINPSYSPTDHYEAVKNCRPELMRFAIANYSVIDPGAAPAGKNAISICGQLDYACNNYWQKNVSYENYVQYKNEIAQFLIGVTERALPGLSDHIEVMEVCSPHTIEGYTLSTRGTILGYGFGFDELYNELRDYGIGTPIDNLYLTGQFSGGGGQPLVILGGMLTASSIIAREPDMEDITDFLVDGFNSTLKTMYLLFKDYVYATD